MTTSSLNSLKVQYSYTPLVIWVGEKPLIKKEILQMSLYENIHKKRARIKAGSGEKMRKVGSKGAPTAANFKAAAKTAKKNKYQK